MKNKKVMALILATAMVAGSSMAVFAADASSAESEGTSFEHVNKDVTDVTLPTDTAVATVFDYYVDPEGAIKSAGTLLDGTAVTGNDDGVYFVNAGTAAVSGTAAYSSTTNTGNYTVTVSDLTVNATYTYDGSTDNQWEDSEGNTATVTITITDDDNSDAPVTPADGDTVTVSGAVAAGSAGYSSSSDAVKFEGKNSVDVDVTVAATVTATDADKDIALVADQAALDAATGPALLMTLKVGSDTKVITSAGTMAKATIAGVASNFTTKPSDDESKFEFALKDAADLTAWNSTTVQLVGKTNKKEVPAGANAMTVPKITLTWTVAKHESYTNADAHGEWSGNTLWLAKDASTGFSTTGLVVEVSDGGTTYKTLAAGKYTIDTSNGWVGIAWDDIVAELGGEPTGTAYVRVTDGTTRFVFADE